MQPQLIWYYMHYHPEMFQREFTDAELVTIVVTSVSTVMVVFIVLGIINKYLERYWK